MAKRKKRRSWFRLLVLGLLTAVVVWFAAFMVWLFWSDIERLVKSGGKKTVSEQTVKPSKERIFDEDRKKLDQILKRK
ncbi:MAG: hypothetical protein ACREQA_06760 [Candidatus Binatia bacterium]